MQQLHADANLGHEMQTSMVKEVKTKAEELWQALHDWQVRLGRIRNRWHTLPSKIKGATGEGNESRRRVDTDPSMAMRSY